MLEETLKRVNPKTRVDTEDDRNSVNWSQAEFFYKEGKGPIVVEMNYNTGNESLAAVESQEFIDDIGSPGLSMSKRRVIKRLRKTRFILSCQLLSDIDDDGYRYNGELLDYFVKNHDGLIQADGEGFYEGHKLIVDMS